MHRSVPKQLNYEFDPNTDNMKCRQKILKFHIQLFSL